MSVSQQELDGVTLIIKDSTTNGYAQISSLAIVLFDYLLTFDDEVALVWQRPSWGIGSILFNRYTGIFSLAFNSAKHHHYSSFHWVRYQIGGTIGAFWLVDVILALRVYALWGRSKRILIFLCVMFSGNAIVAGLVFQVVTVMHRPGSFAYGCYPQGFPVWTFLLAIPEVLSSGTLLALTLSHSSNRANGSKKRAVIYAFHKRRLLVLSMHFDNSSHERFRVFKLHVNSGSFRSGNCVRPIQIFLRDLPLDIKSSRIPCVFGSRILLGLRRQLLKQQVDPSMPSMATIQFGGAERTTHTVLSTISYDSGEVELQETSLGTTQSSNLESAQDGIAEKTDARAPLQVVDARDHQ
ncbi:hypothetical protein ACEPAG_466 [Sanghuangporus baumii]